MHARSKSVYGPAPASLLRRKCACGGAEGAGCRNQRLLRRKLASGAEPDAVPAIVHEVLRSRGRPLDAATRAFMEPRFGHDFSRVRVHTDARAAESAWAVNAEAYAVGQGVVFGEQRFAPSTVRGLRLLAHELTHVVQQEGAVPGLPSRIGRADDVYEEGARQAADAVLDSAARPTVGLVGETVLARTPDEPNRIWGGFHIDGDLDFVNRVRTDLDQLNGTSNGGALLAAITENRRPFYRSRVRIEPSSACGLSGTSGNILYNAAGCRVPDACGGTSPGWTSVPNYVYLHHEIVHAYLYHVVSRESDPDRECMATGLGRYFDSMPYSENRLRCDLGLPVRPCYDGECTRFAPPTCGSATPTRPRP